MPATIAFLGLGQMGAPMARRLVDAGFTVRAWNRTPSRLAQLPGAVGVPTPADACATAEIAITMLSDDRAVEAAVFGPDGLAQALAPGAVHLGMSTVSVALCRRLADEHAALGQRFVAAPVFGRPDAAAAGALFLVPGGHPDDLSRCAPVFAALGQGTFPMPSAPHACLAKLLGNFLIATTIETLGEAMTLGEKAGLSPELLLEMLVGTIFGSPVVKRYGAMLAAGEYEPAGFPLPLGLKDLNLVLAAAEEAQVPMPAAGLVRDHVLAALAQGRAPYDWAGLVSVIREQAGLPERRG